MQSIKMGTHMKQECPHGTAEVKHFKCILNKYFPLGGKVVGSNFISLIAKRSKSNTLNNFQYLTCEHV